MRVNGPIQLYPLARVAVVLVAGIVAGESLAGRVSPTHLYCVLLTSLLPLMLTAAKPLLQSFFVWTSVFLLGACLHAHQHEQVHPQLPDAPVLYEAVLLSEPEQQGKVVRCDMMILGGPLSGTKVKASILRDTVAHRYRRLHVGDGLRAFSVLEPPRAVYGNSRFDYPRWLRAHGFAATTFVFHSDWEKCQVSLSPMPTVDAARLRALQARQRLLKHYQAAGLSDEAYALVAAMTLGYRSALRSELKEAYAVSGASHVLALSGLHLGIVSIVLLLLFRPLRSGRSAQLVLVPVVWLYVFLVGLSPSIVRAAIMLTAYSVVSMSGRNRLSLNTLALSAVLMLTLNPLTLWDVGFQFSFMAMLSIFLFFRPVYRCVNVRWLERHRLMKAVWTVTVVSFTAQIGVAPLLAYYFGRFSTYFLLTNLLVVPCAYAILCGALLLFLSMPLAPVQQLLAGFLKFVVGLQNRGLEWIASLPGASIEPISLSATQVALIYLLIAALASLGVYLQKMRRIHRQFHTEQRRRPPAE